MADASRTGRPRASSRETIADAACELFFEQGYDRTSIVDITRRAGVGRSSFFNYFAAKSDVLWAGFDERVATAIARFEDMSTPADAALVLRGIGEGFAPDALALAVANDAAMGLIEELARDRATRQAVLQRAIAARLRHEGASAVVAEVRAGAWAAAVLAAVWAWAERGAGAGALEVVLDDALRVAARVADTGDGEGAALA